MSMWMMESYRNRKWAYYQLPQPGDVVRYMTDGLEAQVSCVHWDHICLTDGTIYRRRMDWSKIQAWITTHLRRKSVLDAPTERPLKPVTPYVQEVVLVL